MRGNLYESVFHGPRQPDPTVALSAIVKVAGETCNINCFYCYEKRKPYPSAKYLAPEALQCFLEKLPLGPVSVEIHGGEPLIIGLDRMRELLKVLRNFPNLHRVSLQTNGTLLDAAWLNLFDELVPSLELGISLDGDEDANMFRRDYLDDSTSLAVTSTLELLSKRHRACGVIAVVSKANICSPEVTLQYFTQWQSVRSLSFVPCFDFDVAPKRIPKHNAERMRPLISPSNPSPRWAITPAEFTTFLTRAAEFWVTNQLFNNFALEPVMSIIRKLEGRHTGLCHFTNLKCAQVLTLYPDGRVGSCDELPFSMALLGRLDDLTHSELLANLSGTAAFDALEPLLRKCLSCSYRPLCGGGCLSTRLRYFGSNHYEAYCDHRIAVIDAVRLLWSSA